MSKKGENTHDITLILIFIKKYFIRLKFYKKNGFNETEYFIDDDIEYSILSTNKDFNKEEYTKTLKKYSFGLYNPKIKNI